jgi:hypothetical protein
MTDKWALIAPKLADRGLTDSEIQAMLAATAAMAVQFALQPEALSVFIQFAGLDLDAFGIARDVAAAEHKRALEEAFRWLIVLTSEGGSADQMLFRVLSGEFRRPDERGGS